MASRVCIALAICIGIATSATAQVVRFQTSIGDFDMVLNPTNNPLLAGHAENMVRYIENGNYNGSWINRAAEGFVLQMGGFFSHTLRPALTVESTRPVASFGPITGSPQIAGLSNTVGTVALALSGNPANPNSGSNSFFINLGNNSSLDNAFTVFAAIPNMDVVNQIMALTQQDLSGRFGQTGSLAFIDVPIQANGFQVFIERAFVVTDAMVVTAATAGVQSAVALSSEAAAAAASVGSGAAASLPLMASASVPEPSSALMALTAAIASALLAIRRRR
jgi:cyclophilin family peptidyl-prolyl cis-trans isomerase